MMFQILPGNDSHVYVSGLVKSNLISFSVERQMRFLASKKEKGANTTTVNGPSALGSIPAAGLPISMPSSYGRNRTSPGDFTYRPVFSPPALKNRVVSPIVNLNTSLNKYFFLSLFFQLFVLI